MLQEIAAYDFAIMKKVRLPLGPGFNVITGETGAGKSILIGALGLALGRRASEEMIRAGADRSRVEAVFSFDERADVLNALIEAGFRVENGELVVVREIIHGGRNMARINETPCTTAFLNTLGKTLVDIHGQHEHQQLLDRASHRGYLDRSAGPRMAADLEQMEQLWRRHRDLDSKIQDLLRAEDQREREIELLKFQVSEINAATLQPGELDELQVERKRLANHEKIVQLMNELLIEMGSDSDETPSVRDRISKALGHIETLAELDPEFNSVSNLGAEALDAVETIADMVRNRLESTEFDPGRLQEIEDRLHLIKGLSRKYGTGIEEILDYGWKASERLVLLEDSEAAVESMEKESAGILEQMRKLDRKLNRQRTSSARKLEKGIESELGQLAMERARFRVRVNSGAEESVPGRYGSDQVSFEIETNPGQGFKPLESVASGGEASRIMLAVKTVLSRADTIPIMVFDEIDAGVGGQTARAIGRKLSLLGREHQVICVTHLPQIAALADAHFRIVKSISEKDTEVMIEPLGSAGDRIMEIARMLGEVEGAESSRRHAEALLVDAEKWKTANFQQ